MDTGTRGRGQVQLVPVTGGSRRRSTGEVRWSRVKTARARIAAGFYDRESVRRKLVDAVLDELESQ